MPAPAAMSPSAFFARLPVAAPALDTGALADDAALPRPPSLPAIEPKPLVTLPATAVTLPNTVTTGPTAAAMASPLTIMSCIGSGRLLNASAAPLTTLTNSVSTGTTTGTTASPNCMPAFFKSFSALAKFCALELSILPNASLVAPAESAIDCMALLKSSACCTSVAAPFAASCELNTSPIDLPDSVQASWTMLSTSVNDIPDSINSWNDLPVFSFNISDTSVPAFPSSLSMLLRYVVDSAVAIPFLVVVT